MGCICFSVWPQSNLIITMVADLLNKKRSLTAYQCDELFSLDCRKSKIHTNWNTLWVLDSISSQYMTHCWTECWYQKKPLIWLAAFMVFKATFNNISVILWQSVLFMEETTDLLQVTDKLCHIMLYTSPWVGFELSTSVVIGTDCIVSYEPKHHMITTTAAPFLA